jgi:hypothetical protein
MAPARDDDPSVSSSLRPWHWSALGVLASLLLAAGYDRRLGFYGSATMPESVLLKDTTPQHSRACQYRAVS